jgi:hypothetical protein
MEAYKICTKCKIEKNLTEFNKNKRSKSGHQSSSKMCQNINAKEFRLKYSRLEAREMKEKKVCCCCKKEKDVLEYSKNRCCRDGLSSVCKDCNSTYSKARRLYDSEFKQLGNLRSRLGRVLKGRKSQTTLELIGVDFEIFAKWIEFQFEEGMTMENYGSVWHYDHVLPISSFNLLDEEELFKAMNWMNIRPLPPVKNIQKANKIDPWLNVMQDVKAHYFIKYLAEM